MTEEVLLKDISILQALLDGPDKPGTSEWFNKVRWGYDRLTDTYRTVKRLAGEKDDSIISW